MNNNGLYDHNWINIDGNDIHNTAIIHPNVSLGKGNVIGAYAVIGSNGEMRGVSQDDFAGKVIIGDNNVISEHVTVQRPFAKHSVTRIGDNNLIMAHSHIGHDAQIGDHCEICTSSIIGGYVTIKNNVKIKLSCTLRNRITVGEGAVVGMGAVVTRDVPPETTVIGNPAKPKYL